MSTVWHRRSANLRSTVEALNQSVCKAPPNSLRSVSMAVESLCRSARRLRGLRSNQCKA